jgi:hypothetical protein
MKFVVLNVAYPFAPVGPEALGGAEQVPTRLDSALVRAGHESFVMACEGSATEGILLATPKPSGRLEDAERRRIHEQYRFTLQSFLEKWPIDLIHMHGSDFYEYLPAGSVPVLVTLHSPVDRYPEWIFHLDRPQTFLQCVSTRQRSACPACSNLLPDFEYGPTDELADATHAARSLEEESYHCTAQAIEKYLSLYEQLIGQARALEPVTPPFRDAQLNAAIVSI